MGPFDRSLNPLYRILKEKIINNGIIPIKTKPTKTNINKSDTWIDHLFTNKPLLIIGHKIIPTGLSDHKILIFHRKSTRPVEHPKIFLARKFSEVNWNQVEQDLNEDPRIQQAAIDDNSERIATNIIEAINEALDKQQEVKKIQINTKVPTFCTPETVQLIKDKEKALEKAKQTKSIDDIRKFKHIKNQVHKEIKNDKKQNQK